MSSQVDSLSPQAMQMFVSGLAGLPEAEMNKAKTLYIRNAISEYNAQIASYKAHDFMLMFFALIPLFWPILYAGYRQKKSQLKMYSERIQNAIDVWGDDLNGEKFEFTPYV